jgi:hypothetical protein
MTELGSSSTRIKLAGERSPEDERQMRQILRRLADDLIEKAQLLRSLCSETNAAGVFNHPVLFCDENNCPHRKRFKKVSFKSKQLEALRKRLCQELVRM